MHFLKGSLIVLFLFSTTAHAVKVRVATLAVTGTKWATTLKEMQREINLYSGDMDFKFIFNGAAGDETEVLKKIKKGKLAGAILTGRTLGDISGDVRVMELPFTFFDDRDKANAVLRKMTPFLNEGLENKGFKNLGFFELGMVYLVSMKKTASLKDLKGQKVWTWKGDRLARTMLKKMKLPAVQLPLPKVLPSFIDGSLDAAYGPPMGIMGMEWHKKVKYLVDAPFAYSIGAFLISKKTWAKLSEGDRRVLVKYGGNYMPQLSNNLHQDNSESLAMMKYFKIKFSKFSKKSMARLKKLRKKIIKSLDGKLFSDEALSKLESHL